MHILVVRNNSNPQAVDASLLLTAYLTSQGIEALLVDSSSLGTDAGRREVRAQLPGQLALVVGLGGDGTVLHTVHLLHDRQVPILPINFGRLGFLANADTDGVAPLVAEALAGDLRAERRSILSIEVVCEGEHDPYGEANGAGEGAAWDRPDVNAKPSAATPPSVRRPGETEGAPWTPVPGRFGVNGRGLSGARQFFALNEAAITRGAMGRIIDVEDFLADYPCDPDGGELCIDLEIEDDLLPWNDHTFRIRFADGGCTLTDAPAEYHLKMGIGTLSTLLLGYKTAERLFELERIEGREDAVERLDDVLFHKIPYISDYI